MAVAGEIGGEGLIPSTKQFGTAHMPSSIVIERPREAFRITISVLKVVVNQPLGDEQFELKIPSEYKVQTLQ